MMSASFRPSTSRTLIFQRVDLVLFLRPRGLERALRRSGRGACLGDRQLLDVPPASRRAAGGGGCQPGSARAPRRSRSHRLAGQRERGARHGACAAWQSLRGSSEWRSRPTTPSRAAGGPPWTSLPAKPWPCSAAKGRAVAPSDDRSRSTSFRRSTPGRTAASRARSGACGTKRAVFSTCPKLAINATAVRVPVFFGHSLAVHAAFERPLSALEAVEVLQRGSGISVIDRRFKRGIPDAGHTGDGPG